MPRTKGSKNKPKTVTAEIASITANIDTLKADLKEKKTALEKTEAESVVKRLLARGMSADEILEKLK